ncbi:MAG: cyclic nucleotide-binding domain-containing protein, partial [Flavobacteriales bacterium]|nr:cyclic nucleotide-binding domain-containing protein [Flavobacteriales bacterium]
MQELINKIKKSIQLSSKAEKHLYAISTEKTFSKGEVLIRQGQSVRHTYFVLEGNLRSFCTDKNGKEHT